MPELILQQAPDLLGMQRNALSNELMRQDLKALPGEKSYIQKKRGWEEEDRKRFIEANKFKDEEDVNGYLIKELPMMNYQNWNQSRQYLIDLGIKPFKLLTREQIDADAMSKNINPEQHFESYKNYIGTTAAQKFELAKDQQKQRFELQKTAIGKMPETGKTRTIQKGMEEITQEWDGEKWTDIGRGPKWAPKDDYSESISVDPKTGQVTVTKRSGKGGAETGMTRPTQGKVEEDLYKTGKTLQRTVQTAMNFKPEYQQLGTRWNALATSLKSKAGLKVDPQEQKLLQDFTIFKSQAYNNLNVYLNEISGAAVSEAEMERLKQDFPFPGKGLLDGDDPITFKSKLDGKIKQLKLVQAKYKYILKNGLTKEEVDFENMPSIMAQRGDEIFQQLLAQGVDPAQAQQRAASQIKLEFGL